jgi:carbon-monoxide dehydrogenase small subunit
MLVASTVFAALAVMDGRVIRGCLALAVEADGREIETIEGATKTGRVAVLQEAFYERAALQCGFCTTAMILQAGDLVAQNTSPTRAEIRTATTGNYCRCTVGDRRCDRDCGYALRA